ncbi:hypothetical protein Thiowin_04276 [Thiorhodovibrio winogradskyi]|uniref:DUF302 domain-containing protein n=1 Tax=Thiorhodovibrio winogradskyi TaxID=77007 RepID=A0ABZ0SFS2_9GAMM|nr:DUF302 domain-containing protein [Thiorhodovibrio winogradskyi]
MKLVRNIFAVIGVISVLALGYGSLRLNAAVADFDPEFSRLYRELAKRLLETGDPGIAIMWSIPVEDGLTPEDVIDSMKNIAISRNFLFVGESPFYKQIQAITGEDYRYVNFLSFCDARVGRMMLEYRNEYSGFMPCRIALVEDTEGKLTLYSMNLDLMIHGGKELPPDLKASALRVRDTLLAIMEGGAAGEF